jgi:hypothetical protein
LKLQEEADKGDYPGWADESGGGVETKGKVTATPTAPATPPPEAYLTMRIEKDTG